MLLSTFGNLFTPMIPEGPGIMELGGTRRKSAIFELGLTTDSKKEPRPAQSHMASFPRLSVCHSEFLQSFHEVCKTWDCTHQGNWPRNWDQEKKAKGNTGVRVSSVVVTSRSQRACPLSLFFKPPEIQLAESLGI